MGLLVLDVYLVASILRGAPYAPTKPKAIKIMLKALAINADDKSIDIGSGDGRLVIALAQAGAEAHGYEINPLLVWWSRVKIKRAGLENKAFIHQQSFWKTNFGDYSIVTVFGMTHIMKELSEKFQKELPVNAKIAANTFTLPNWKPDFEHKGIYIYTKRNATAKQPI